VRGTLKVTGVGCRGGEQARQQRAGSLKPLQDLHHVDEALWTRLRSVFCCLPILPTKWVLPFGDLFVVELPRIGFNSVGFSAAR
jgi:hypothetical protein